MAYRHQANALMRKSISYQMRNVTTNICLISAPIVFCLILFVIQLLVDNLYLGTEDFQCGCKCTECCYEGRNQTNGSPFYYVGDASKTMYVIDDQNRNDGLAKCVAPIDVEIGPCPENQGYACLTKDDSMCGVQYSDSTQAAFCDIPNPSTWPAVLTVPYRRRRFQPNSPDVTLLVTSDDANKSEVLGSQLWNQLDLSFGRVIPLLEDIVGPNFSFNGHILSELGFQFGASTQSRGDYYVENAFLQYNSTYVMLPQDTCNRRGIDEYNPVTLIDFLAKYIGLPPLFLRQLLNSSGADGIGSQLANTFVGCADSNMWTQETVDDVNEALRCGYWQSRCPDPYTFAVSQFGGAWDFANSSAQGLNVTVQYNTTGTNYRGSPNPNLRIPSMVSQAAKAWWRTISGDTAAVPPITLLGVKSMPKSSSELDLDFASQLGPLFYTWVVTLLMPTFLQQLVYEKEKRLRMMMKMHGLGDWAYWSITYAWFMIVYIVYIAIFIVFGALVGLKVFRLTNIGIQIIFYLLHGNCMIAFTFLLSSFFSSARTASICAFIYVFASGLIGSLLLSEFINQDQPWMFYVEWVPSWSLFRGLQEQAAYSFLGAYRDTTGMQFSNLNDDGNGMLAVWGIFIVEWVLFMILAWYFEQVIYTGNGIRHHPLFFINWMWRKEKKLSHVIPGGEFDKTEKPAEGVPITITASGPIRTGRPETIAEETEPLTAAKELDASPSGGGFQSVSFPRTQAVAEGTEIVPRSQAVAEGTEIVPVTANGPGVGQTISHLRPQAIAEANEGVHTPLMEMAGGAGAPTSSTDATTSPTATPTSPIAQPTHSNSATRAMLPLEEGETANGLPTSLRSETGPTAASAATVTLTATSEGTEAATAVGSAVNNSASKREAQQGPDTSAVPSLDPSQIELTKLASPWKVAPGSRASSRFTDVQREEMRVRNILSAASGDPHVVTSDCPIVMEELRQVFRAMDGRPPKVAVESMTLAINRGECFGLLGPNGAGKTTLLSMLIGFLEPTSGWASVEGLDITKDIQKVYSIMGVCPQHDLLWDQLTAREHLRFYGRLKGIGGKELEEQVEAALKSVNLLYGGVGDKLSKKYSGGMKRRLSVAISFMGAPKVVYLDEPSTGLDPNSRRNLWDVVKRNKDGRAIILTTHSMEEAEALCDRLGIFVDGQLVCIGNPKEITARYGGYLVFQISVPNAQVQDAKDMVLSMCPSAVLTYSVGGTLKYELPTRDVTYNQVFEAVTESKGKMEVLDWAVANVTLEEVFIKFARAVNAKSGDLW